MAQVRAIARHWIVRLRGGVGRTVGVIVCMALAPPLVALFAISFVVSLACGGGLRSEDYLGRDRRTFRLYHLDFGKHQAPHWLCRLPIFLNVLRGDLGLVGPRPLRPEEAPRRSPQFWTRSWVRPGLISLFWLRQRTNIAFETELATDVEYAEQKSVRTDLGIALRAAPAALYGGEVVEAPPVAQILGVHIRNLLMNDAVDEIARCLAMSSPVQVCFVNASCLNSAYREPRYFDVLERAFLVLADGIGLKLAGRLLHRPIRQNVNGTDLFPHLCDTLARSGRRMFLLGGRPGVAEAVAAWIREHAPGLAVCGLHHGYFEPREENAVIAEIAVSQADVLLVAFGSPRQDRWISDHLPRLNVRVAMGVGGLFDFYSGLMPRAPSWVRELGLEWGYRFLQEPQRMWRRYLIGNFLFLYRVGRERLGMSLPGHIDRTKGNPT
ncbi:MAG TPA: WecB/TagA/CpsF family glycosyltransferase [Bryobacteraceae bacterium]|nr:WecB/TagA/CpsF family glycosyltransferase [Bryobacteraceae bacterium]